jgi:hypothetical protein
MYPLVPLVVSLVILIWLAAVGRTVLAVSRRSTQTSAVSSNWGLNQILACLLLLLAVGDLADANVYRHFVLHGGSEAGFYIGIVLQVMLGVALFVGRSRRTRLALRAGLATSVAVGLLARPSLKWLADPAFLLMSGSVFVLTGEGERERTEFVPRMELPGWEQVRNMSVAQSACYVIAMLLFASGVTISLVMAARGGLLGESPRLLSMWRESQTEVLVLTAAGQFIAASALCVAQTRPFALAGLFCWSLFLAAVKLQAAKPAIAIAIDLAQVVIYGSLCALIVSARRDEIRFRR